MKLLLASHSPRRRELLSLLDFSVQILEPREVDEVYPPSLQINEVPAYLSKLKATAYDDYELCGDILITADTVVVSENKILGKPKGREDAVSILQSLSAKTHQVITGVTLKTDNSSITFSEITQVTFDELPLPIIEKYVDKYKPFDKAGAYGIQEFIGCVGISGINGCYYNVMGLPLHTLYKKIAEIKLL